MKLHESVISLLRCPVCKSKFNVIENECRCANTECGTRFPVIDGIPVLINESSSIFSIQDFVERRNTFFHQPAGTLKQFLAHVIPTLDHNITSKKNYAALAELLLQANDNPKVLIIGGSIEGQELHELLLNQKFLFVETDVSFGSRTMLICDAHDLPFQDASFDGIIAQAVLEHVIDPYQCVAEIHRVLNERGLVYAETPFMQQVHAGKYDFTRFTHLGHRRLFRKFEEVSSGPVDGPGMALGWSYRYFLLSFTESKHWRTVFSLLARFTGFWLKYFDYFLIKKSGTLDATSGLFFLGRKSSTTLADKELVKQYRGCIR